MIQAEEGSGTSTPVKTDPSLEMDFSDMKKKKKKSKKEIPLDLVCAHSLSNRTRLLIVGLGGRGFWRIHTIDEGG